MEKTQRLNITNKNLLLTYGTLLVLNTMCLITLTKKIGTYNLDGTYNEANSTGLIVSALLGLIFSIPLLCAILSTIIAFFINRKESYRKRFLKTLLFTLVIVYTIMFVRYTMLIFLN